MNKLYLGTAAIVSLVVMVTSSSVAMAKGTSDNPAVVIIDQSDSSNDVDANITNDSSNPIPVTTVEYRVVGLTPSEVPANIGIGGMNGACDSAFPNMDARMCTSLEVIKTPGSILMNLHNSPGLTRGWVQPVGVTRNITYNPQTQSLSSIASEATGMALHQPSGLPLVDLNCQGWINNAFSGLALVYSTVGDALEFRRCDSSQGSTAVTCCASR
jgi:hypothetical protein